MPILFAQTELDVPYRIVCPELFLTGPKQASLLFIPPTRQKLSDMKHLCDSLHDCMLLLQIACYKIMAGEKN